MANQMKHTGNIPETIFIVSEQETQTFWIYIKEGHAINRMLNERKAGKSINFIKYSAVPSEDRGNHDS